MTRKSVKSVLRQTRVVQPNQTDGDRHACTHARYEQPLGTKTTYV
jgi:hypothetical protein